MIENALQVRLGQLDESLVKVVDALMQFSPLESTRLVLELSRDDLLARFGSENN